MAEKPIFPNVKNSVDDKKTNINFVESINLTNDSFSLYWLKDTFIVFKSVNDILYLIYSIEKNSIISFNLIKYNKINEIKNAHFMRITSFRHYLDINNKRDLMISISADDNNLKLWDINNFELLFNFENINSEGYMFSGCFLNDNNNIYIVSSNYKSPSIGGLIKIFDLYGNKIKEINKSKDNVLFIDNYYCKDENTNYIITGNYGYIKSYNYNQNKLYHKYCDTNKENHFSFIINKKESKTYLIDSGDDGKIRLWDFHTGDLINIINAIKEQIFDICIFKNRYILAGCIDYTIKIIDLEKGGVDNVLEGHNHRVITIKSFFHPKFGDCIISQGWLNEPIKLWINKI